MHIGIISIANMEACKYDCTILRILFIIIIIIIIIGDTPVKVQRAEKGKGLATWWRLKYQCNPVQNE